MLESRVIRELCRNGKCMSVTLCNKPDTTIKTPEQEQRNYYFVPLLAGEQGFFMAPAAEIAPYRLIDDIPELARPRAEAREEAWAMVAQRQELQCSGEAAIIPLPIDALSTAEKVIEAAGSYGEGSDEHQEKLAGLQLDMLRLVAEWHRKLKPEYFPPIRHVYDAETEDFYSHGLSIRQMTENALTPMSDNPEEVARRVNERVEDATPQIIKKLGGFALGRVGIRTISECTDKAVNDYQQDVKTQAKHRGYGGYVPEIEKVMIRDMRFDAATGDRLEEQVGLPGVYINHFVIQKALGRKGAEVGHMGKTELHGSQMLVGDDLIDFVQLLDQVASEEWCTPIFMGEAVAADHAADYSSIRLEAAKRQENLKDIAATVANFVIDLVEDGFDRHKAPAHVEDFVKKMLLDMAKNDISLASQMFDEKTADGLREVKYLESIGRYEDAFTRFEEVEKAAPGGGFCGAGSCGLESVDTLSEAGKELVKKLKADAGDKIVKDKDRACRCGKKEIVYAYNKNKVTKYCQSCSAFESKTSKAA